MPRIPAIPAKVVDTTGAGDAFNGALTVGLSRKQRLKEAVQFAVKVSGFVVTQKGAQVQIPSEIGQSSS